MENELVSIVIPIYNARKYLEQCISSVLNQTYGNIEVILVNDGSTDGCSEICEKYANLDNRVKLISQCNQGVVSARKNGTNIASGKYIGFVDADDYIDADLYEQFMACRGDFDLVISQWYREEQGKVRHAFDKLALGAYQTKEDLDFLLDHMINVSAPGGSMTIQSGLVPFMYVKLYRTSLVKEVFSEVNEAISVWEDCEFYYRYLLKVKRVLITDICGYHYRIHEASAVHSVDYGCRYLKNICMLYESLNPVFLAHPKRDSLVSQFQFKIASLLNRLPSRMGFSPENQNKVMVFPFLNLLDHKCIALYGAGEIGRTYWCQIQQLKACESVLWVDQEWEVLQRAGWDVSPVENLAGSSYDYVVIAAAVEDEADHIKKELLVMGVDEGKILWRKPYIL